MAASSVRIGQLTTRAALQPETWNAEARTVEVVWTTGARGLRRSYFGDDFYEELEVSAGAVDLSRLNNGAPVLNSHDASGLGSVIGVVEKAWIVGNEGRARVRFSDREDVQPIVRDVASGIIRHWSVGYEPKRYKDVGELDGKRILRAVDWLPMELSPVAIGFDDRAVTRSSPDSLLVDVPIERGEEPRSQEPAMADPQGASPAPVTATASAAPVSAPVQSAAPTVSALPVPGPSTPSLNEAEIRAAAVRDERERMASIQRAVRAAKLGEDFASKLIAEGVSADAARAAVLDHLASTSTVSAIPVRGSADVTIPAGGDNAERWQAGAQARIFERAGLVSLMEKHAAKHGESYKADSSEFRSMRLFDLARDSLIRSGMSYSEVSRLGDRDLVAKAFTRSAGNQSTGEFATLLENTMHKVLLAAYELYPADYPRFCKIGSVSDFRAHPFYRRGSLGRLQKVLPGGEIENLKVADGRKESLQAYTYAGIVGLDREVIINDDLSVFSDMAFQAGEAAAYTIEQLVFDMLAENSGLGPDMSDALPLFDSTRTVIDSTGTSRDLSNIYPTGTTISVANLDANRVQMAQMRDVSGNRVMGIKPTVLLLPVGLEGTARVINNSQWDVDPVTTNATNMFQKPNKIQGLFSDIVGSPHLSGTRRYLFADPSRYPTLMVAFLNGQSSPVIESREGWRSSGTEWRILLDAAVGAVDFRSALTDDGTP